MTPPRGIRTPGAGRRMAVSRNFALLLLCSLLLLGGARSVLPQEPTSLSDLDKRIAELQRELEEAGRRAEQLGMDETQQAALLRELGSQIANSEQLINALTRRIREDSDEAARLQEEIASLGTEMETLGEAVAAYVVGLYKHGRRRSLEIVLGSGGFTEAVRRFKGVTILATRQREDVDRLGQTRDLRIGKRTEITRTLDRLQSDREAQRNTRTNLDAKRRQTQGLLNEIASDRAQLRRYMEQSEAALADLIEQKQEMIRRLRAAGRPVNIALGGFEEMRGRLPWPLWSSAGPGSVVRRFGRQTGRDNTVTSSVGIDILAPPGPEADIIAVHNAEVLHIGWLEFLGTVIILDHGDDYVTVYTNTKDLLVQQGYPVLAGSPMAHVGRDMPPVGDEPAGRLLRFSIYRSTTPLDPDQWLGGGR